MAEKIKKYDCIIVGSGHAGIEAAHSAANLGCSVLMLTIDIDAVGKLSCNPAVGGVCKGNLVREIDALGGLIGKITDKCALGYRVLNRSKGKAVWSTRAQVDMFLYAKIAKELTENKSGINVIQAQVKRIVTKNNKLIGVESNFGEIFYGKTVIVCAGTFLKSTIHIGLNSFPGGRLYELSSDHLFESIRGLGFATKHFKTGTCARLDARTVNFKNMIEQVPDRDVLPFSFSNKKISKERLSCFITYTNKNTHKIILKNLKYSPLYTGKIKAKGVRYCPSLEDKIVKFSDKERHQVFIEPEGKLSIELYPNGISTSLPFDVQMNFIRTIDGLENACILRPGYGIEHGLIDAKQLYLTLESKIVDRLYFAGQVNGTTGYEEAAAQGLIAGINAALKVRKDRPFVLSRDSSYIGVLIDDLITKGTDEPYRMFTSRSEFRLSLRESNAHLRLVPLGYKLGLLNKSDYELILDKRNSVDKGLRNIRSKKIFFGGKSIILSDFLKRPEITFKSIERHLDKKVVDLSIQREIEILIKYEGFLRRESIWFKELRNLDKIKLGNINYSVIPSLSKEVVEKLNKFNPNSLGEAINISGVTPAAILNIYSFLKKNKAAKKKNKSICTSNNLKI